MDIALSNKDLDLFIKEVEKNGLNMVEIKNLTPNTHINDIFDNGGHCILFYENKGQSVGHWLTLLRNPEGKVYFLDSYGMDCDYYDPVIKKCIKNNKKNGVKSFYINTQKLQDEPNSMTCGRYGIIFTSLNKAGMNPEDMVEFLKQGGKEKGSVDKYVISLFGE